MNPQPAANTLAALMRWGTLASLVALLTACQTPRHKEFQSVKSGMEKDLVIEAAGGPLKSRRWQGKDRWTYEFKETPDGPQTREIHFEQGRAVYVGPEVKPKVSAEEQDRINEEKNKQMDQQISEEQSAWERQRGVARPQRAASTSSGKAQRPSYQLDDDDRRLQEAYYGTVDLEHEKQKRAPNFRTAD